MDTVFQNTHVDFSSCFTGSGRAMPNLLSTLLLFPWVLPFMG
jgi:hypothetical protein